MSKYKELAAKFVDIRAPEEAYKFAISIQSGFTKEEFIDTIANLHKATKSFNELNDEDLAKVAGGDVDITVTINEPSIVLSADSRWCVTTGVPHAPVSISNIVI